MIPSLPGLLHTSSAGGGTEWTLDNVQYVGSLTVATQIEDFMISPDGSRFYYCNETDDLVYQWDLATPGLISSGVDNNLSYSPGTTSTKGFTFNNSGSKLYVKNFNASGTPNDPTFQHSVSNILDITSASPDGIQSSDPINTLMPRFNGDGMKLRTNDRFSPYSIFNKDLVSPFEINGISGFDSQFNLPFRIFAHSWKDDGTSLMISGRAAIWTDLYSRVGDDITTLNLIQSIDLVAIGPVINVGGVFVSDDGKNMYVPEQQGNVIHQYSL